MVHQMVINDNIFECHQQNEMIPNVAISLNFMTEDKNIKKKV
jgi:hypothetical protein